MPLVLNAKYLISDCNALHCITDDSILKSSVDDCIALHSYALFKNVKIPF